MTSHTYSEHILAVAFSVYGARNLNKSARTHTRAHAPFLRIWIFSWEVIECEWLRSLAALVRAQNSGREKEKTTHWNGKKKEQVKWAHRITGVFLGECFCVLPCVFFLCVCFFLSFFSILVLFLSPPFVCAFCKYYTSVHVRAILHFIWFFLIN